MSERTKILLALFGGAAAGATGGSLITYIILRKKYDEHLEKEIKELEDYYNDRLGKLEDETERLSSKEAYDKQQEMEKKTKPGDISNPDKLFVRVEPGESIDYTSFAQKREVSEEEKTAHPEDDEEDA